ncbi:type 1 fimbrial protein [Pseudomonas sp. BP8]|uniref:fimbrial protein n=1 Tax=Pseudomonas sp. BP8 TaxID=2817864 RepID=UPI001AE960A2|nr:type 1 fimbrial protein [Pseudomonas sp. BP8]MBP2263574.1 major type 1 subunit fimbrin (pilin) [Pseudomonas sp. BP8]HDS1735565.1 type 1 fimbrial protein [Pseudomonas putida]
MKKTLTAFALCMLSNAALANTGNINFAGSITPGGTCPIEIVEPGTGGTVLPRVVVGSYHPEFFTAAGIKTRAIPFAMRVTPGTGCTIPAGGKATVTFAAIYGIQGTDLYALRPGGARNLALAIQDSSFSNLAPGKASAEYALNDAAPTEMIFYAMYQSLTNAVSPGDAHSEVSFLVDIK